MGKRGLLLMGLIVDKELTAAGLSMAGFVDMSSLISEVSSLLLLHDPSVSLFRFMDSVGSPVFSANICSKPTNSVL